MCGIAGIVDHSRNDLKRKIVHDMCNNMDFRGPDYFDIAEFKKSIFGHRRLSIIDLSITGNQPMFSYDKKYCIIFNGEIYNYRQLREILSLEGYKFHTNSDTEVLLNGYIKWGLKLPDHCIGMWAFAIWDIEKEELFASRDRFGEKPFYYSIDGTRLSFSSTLSGLKPSLTNTKISIEAVSSLLAYEYIPHDECIYDKVQKLEPGYNLIFKKNDFKTFKFWDTKYKVNNSIDVGTAVEKIDTLMTDIISDQLVSDVPVGIFLSGGVDSGYIAAKAAGINPGITTISMTNPGNKIRDESYNARIISSLHKTNHIEVPMGVDCIKDLPNLLSTIEPLSDSSLIPAAAVSKAAKKYLKVVLTGDGGDEVFGGYGIPNIFHNVCNNYSKVDKFFLKILKPLILHLSKQRITPFFRLLRLQNSRERLLLSSGVDKYLDTYESTTLDIRNILYGTKMEKMLPRPSAKFIKDIFHKSNAQYDWQKAFSFQLKTRLLNDYLLKVDSATMFNSIESRAPFLDHRLIDYASQLPFNVLFSDTYNKSLLRKIASRYNPKEIIYSKKKGFSIPVKEFMSESWGILLTDLIRDGISAQLGLINPKGVIKYLKKHGLRASYDLSRQLYSIMTLEIWLRVFHEKTEDPNELGQKLINKL